jgi:ketosteroid isomerase-like protein
MWDWLEGGTSMKKLLPWVVAALSASVSNAGSDTVAPSLAERAVLAAEDAYVAAEVARDEVALHRLVDERFVLNGNDGGTRDKAHLIEGVMGMKMTGQTLSDRTVMVEGNVGLIFGTAELRFATEGADDRKSTFRYTSIYVNRDGEWKFLGLQMTGLVERKDP